FGAACSLHEACTPVVGWPPTVGPLMIETMGCVVGIVTVCVGAVFVTVVMVGGVKRFPAVPWTVPLPATEAPAAGTPPRAVWMTGPTWLARIAGMRRLSSPSR